MARYETVNTIVNRTAVECGLNQVTDVFATEDSAFAQLTGLLTACVQELMEMYDWPILKRDYTLVTDASDTGIYDLPDDFAYVIPQTEWDKTNDFPWVGPLSAQDWTYIIGRDLVSQTIYASFRFTENALYIFPNDPVPDGHTLTFEYISRNVIQAASPPNTYKDEADEPSDVVLFPPNMIIRMLRMKYLDAKGFDTTKATNDFWLSFNSWKGKVNSAPRLNVGMARGYPYLSWRNIRDTGYGGV